LAWGKRRSQRYGGNAASTLARIERKWFLKSRIICLALFSGAYQAAQVGM
jgi:hypothetical protein